jgi:hypothetical protein
MSEISHSIQIVKHGKKMCANCTVRIVRTDVDVPGLYTDMEEPYTDVARLSWRTGGSWTVESFIDTWHLGGEWIGDTWPK